MLYWFTKLVQKNFYRMANESSS